MQVPADSQSGPLRDSTSLSHPMVSVVVPTYNRASLIERSLSSILSQSYKSLEVIVVDDGSQDETANVVNAIQDERVRYLKNRGSKGAAGARNFGMGHARGRHIALLDSDDQWHREKIELQVRILEDNPNIGAVGCGWQWLNMRTSVPRIIRKPDSNGRIDTLPRWFYNIVVDLLMRKEIARSVTFDEELATYEVLDWIVRISALTQVFCIDEVLVDCYDHGEARNSDAGAKRLDVLETIVQRHASFMKGDSHAWAAINHKLGAGLLMGSGDRRRARKYLRVSLSAEPTMWKSWGYAVAAMIPKAPQVLQRLKAFSAKTL